MTEEIKEWKDVLDIPVEHYLEGDIKDSERELIQETYDNMFRKIMEKDRLLNAYRKDHALLKASHLQLIEEVKAYKQRLGEVV